MCWRCSCLTAAPYETWSPNMAAADMAAADVDAMPAMLGYSWLETGTLMPSMLDMEEFPCEPTMP